MSYLVPSVDLSGWAGAGPAERDAIAAEVDAACRSVAFLQVTGHGVDPALIERMLTDVNTFFALPEPEKAQYSCPPDVNRGYAALGTEAMAMSLGVDAPRDLFEAFGVGRDQWPAGDPVYEAERNGVFAPNPWPQRPESFHETVSAYYDEAKRVSRLLLEVFAHALALPEGYFEDKVDHSTDTMRINYYLRRPGSPDPLPEQVRMGAHTDYGIVTVLYADRVPGLEILDPDHTWQPVVAKPEALLVNLGDLLAEWSNDRWKSTLHRVVPPPRGESGPALRRSVAFFCDGNYDALIECLPTCTDENNPPKYAPVVAGEHIRAKVLGPRTLTPAEAVSTLGDRSVAL
jgi:isopenicillin N synthase-like dioxygenase